MILVQLYLIKRVYIYIIKYNIYIYIYYLQNIDDTPAIKRDFLENPPFSQFADFPS